MGSRQPVRMRKGGRKRKRKHPRQNQRKRKRKRKRRQTTRTLFWFNVKIIYETIFLKISFLRP